MVGQLSSTQIRNDSPKQTIRKVIDQLKQTEEGEIRCVEIKNNSGRICLADRFGSRRFDLEAGDRSRSHQKQNGVR